MECTGDYFLNRNFTCQLNCINPCATCSSSSPSFCTSCLLGYVLDSTVGECVPDLSCNTNSACQICPQGYIIQTNNTATTAKQTCLQCTSSSNCARCLSSNLTQCISCPEGSYLSSGICINCPNGCASCITALICIKCQPGFVDSQNGFADTVTYNNMNCTLCQSPCRTCYSNPMTCLSCVDGYSLSGAQCISNFNFAVTCSLSVTMQAFQTNYLFFLSQLAAAANVKTNDIQILSVTSGSVNIAMTISCPYPAGSSEAQNMQNSINSLLSSGNVANMPVSNYEISTNGGSNSSSGGMATSTMIILATVIPIGVLGIAGVFLVVYFKSRKSKEEMVDQSSTYRQNLEMVQYLGKNEQL